VRQVSEWPAVLQGQVSEMLIDDLAHVGVIVTDVACVAALASAVRHRSRCRSLLSLYYLRHC
jgi:hypothetical protein